MAILEIPLRSDDPAFDFTIELERRNYRFSLRWNDRANLWFMDIGTIEGDLGVAGIPLLVDTNLIGRFQSDYLPSGLLLVHDRAKSGSNPGRNDLGNDFLLLYEESTE